MDHRQFQSRRDQRHDLAEVRPTQRTNMSCFLVTSSPYPDAWTCAAHVTLSYPVFHHRLGEWCFHLAHSLNVPGRPSSPSNTDHDGVAFPAGRCKLVPSTNFHSTITVSVASSTNRCSTATRYASAL